MLPNPKPILCFAILQIGGLVGCTFNATSSEAASIHLRIVQAAESGTFQMTASIGSPADLIAPDGTTIERLGTFQGLSYAELSDRFYGEWTIHESLPEATYHFSLSPVPLHQAATMVSPLDGATVGTTFKAAWKFPAGYSPPGPAIAFHHFEPDLVFTTDFAPSGLSAMVNVDLGSNSMAQIQVYGGSYEPLLAYLGPLTPQTFPTPYFVTGSYSSISPPINVTVVPEPCGLALGTLGAVGLFVCASRRVRRKVGASAIFGDDGAAHPAGFPTAR